MFTKLFNCLAAGAIGDAFGYRVEFLGLSSIEEKWPESQFLKTNGIIPASDDTQMTLFTLEGIVRSGVDNTEFMINSIREAYLDWYLTQGYEIKGRKPLGNLYRERAMCLQQAPGNTCLSALRKGAVGSIQNPINDSKGCGGVMRSAPIGFLPWKQDDIFEMGCRSAALTHGHPDGWASAGALSLIIHLLLQGKSYTYSLEQAVQHSERAGASDTVLLLQTALKLIDQPKIQGSELTSVFGEGWTGESALALAAYCAAVSNNFEEVIKLSSRHSGDSDSTASIACQIWMVIADSASYPISYKIPDYLLNAVDLMPIIKRTIQDQTVLV